MVRRVLTLEAQALAAMAATPNEGVDRTALAGATGRVIGTPAQFVHRHPVMIH